MIYHPVITGIHGYTRVKIASRQYRCQKVIQEIICLKMHQLKKYMKILTFSGKRAQ